MSKREYIQANKDWLEVEIRDGLFHKRGALAAAQHRDEILQMRRERNRVGLQELQDKLAAEAEAQVTAEGLTEEQRKVNSTIGGTPHLDGQYTVFGEVEEGLDIVEMIQLTATARGDRPVDDIEMRMILVD